MPGARRCPRGTPCARPPSPTEYRAAWTVQEDAFLEWSVRDRAVLRGLAGRARPRRPGFEPWNLRVVLDPAGEVVAHGRRADGPEHAAFIARLATTKDQRGRGLAQALLVDAFAAGRAHGAAKSELSTDSRTGALGLYEKVGMDATSTWVNRAIAL